MRWSLVIMALWPVESLSLSERLAYTKEFKLHKQKAVLCNDFVPLQLQRV